MIYRPNGEIKTYEEVISEAVAKIPLLSREWTNYNISDPGITILQNFAAFHVLQEESILEVTEAVRRNLLKLMGYTAGVNRAGHAFFIPESGMESFYLPLHQRMTAGETCYETIREEQVGPEMLTGVWVEDGTGMREVTYLLKSEAVGAVRAFCPEAETEPVPGNGIWLVFGRLPDTGRGASLYFAVDEGGRNPFAGEHIPEFARLSWQCYTADGWKPVEVVDETACFLTSGRIVFTMPEIPAVRYGKGDINGYVIRCRLAASDYDCAPVIRAVYDRVIEMEQRKTFAAKFCFSGRNRTVVVPGAIAADGIFEVFVQEKEGACYRRYERGADGWTGRYYHMRADEYRRPVLEFDQESFGFGPCDGKEAVVVVCWSRDAIPFRDLGTVCGYEDQMIEIEHVEHVIPEDFCVMARMKGGRGNSDDTDDEYCFAVPGLHGEEDLGYELLQREGRLRIYHPGYGRECRLYLASCAVVRESGGGLRAGSRFIAGDISLVSISPETGGSTCEPVTGLERRFTEELGHPQTAVTAEDYETLVKQTPGLCIDKVKAWMDYGKNQVELVIRPGNGQGKPGLNRIYKKAVLEYLEPRRMTAANIILVEPVYVPLMVHGRIRGRRQFRDCRRMIEEFLKQRFEEEIGKTGFGGVISYHMMFQELEGLDFVAEVCDLGVSLGAAGARIAGEEIMLDRHCLGYLEYVNLEVLY